MTHITEIIPKDMPDWLQEAFHEGQFFARVVERFEIMEADAKTAADRIEKLESYRAAAEQGIGCIGLLLMEGNLEGARAMRAS